MDSEHDSEIITGEKVVIIGDSSVGKSSIVMRYTKDSFSNDIPATVGVDNYIKEVVTDDNRNVKLLIWDTAGQERFRALAKNYYKNAKCVILVFDITNRKSFENLDSWLDEVFNYTHEGILVVVIGNKSDLQNDRKVTKDEIQAYQEKNQFFYLETSALNNEDANIQKVFKYVGTQIGNAEVMTVRDSKIKKENEIKLDQDGKKDEGCKC